MFAFQFKNFLLSNMIFDLAVLSHPLDTTSDVELTDTSVVHNITLPKRGGGPNLFCEASRASPSIVDIHKAANRMIDEWYDEWCSQTNFAPLGSKCTELKSYKGAQISICNGGKGVDIPCEEAAKTAKKIADKCVRKDRKTGGYWKFIDEGFRIVVH